MGRYTKKRSTAEKLNEATAEAAHVLTGALAVYGDVLKAYVRDAGQSKDYDECQSLLETARGLVKPMVRLSEALAQVKGEVRQKILVERVAKSTEIAPESAPNKPAQEVQNPALLLENPEGGAPNPVGGGGGGGNA